MLFFNILVISFIFSYLFLGSSFEMQSFVSDRNCVLGSVYSQEVLESALEHRLNNHYIESQKCTLTTENVIRDMHFLDQMTYRMRCIDAQINNKPIKFRDYSGGLNSNKMVQYYYNELDYRKEVVEKAQAILPKRKYEEFKIKK